VGSYLFPPLPFSISFTLLFPFDGGGKWKFLPFGKEREDTAKGGFEMAGRKGLPTLSELSIVGNFQKGTPKGVKRAPIENGFGKKVGGVEKRCHSHKNWKGRDNR
jgi:hypothetical protein